MLFSSKAISKQQSRPIQKAKVLVVIIVVLAARKMKKYEQRKFKQDNQQHQHQHKTASTRRNCNIFHTRLQQQLTIAISEMVIKASSIIASSNGDNKWL